MLQKYYNVDKTRALSSEGTRGSSVCLTEHRLSGFDLCLGADSASCVLTLSVKKIRA